MATTGRAVCLIILVVAAATLLLPVASETEDHIGSIFRPSTGVVAGGYCDLSCPGQRKHTLCEAPGGDPPVKGSPSVRCPKFQQLLGSDWLWADVLNAHNGIRNRFAGRSRVANMKKLVWDDELSRMARLWLTSSCDERYRVDPCTQLTNPDLYTRDYRNVRQNVAFVPERYLPRYYDIDVVRRWYGQKAETPRPTLGPAGQVWHAVLNNYTLLTWASLERIGCAAAKYRDGFQLVCNYFPFHSLAEPAAIRGPPASQCPRTFPLRSRVFDALCTFEMDSITAAGTAGPSTGVTCLTLTTMMMLLLLELLTGTGRWFKSVFRGARSSAMNWIGSVSASVARAAVVARRHRNTPNSPRTSAQMTENETNP